MITLDITPKEAKLFLDLLSRASEDMGNAGCNDYDIEQAAEMTPEHRSRFVQKMQQALPRDEIDDSRIQPDWLVLSYFDKLIRTSAALADD